MRIARILTRLNLGGPARQVLASDPRLRERGHELRVFVGAPEPGEGDLAGALAAAGVDVVRVPGLVRASRAAVDGRDRAARRFLARALSDYEPDVVHTHASKAGALGRRAAERGAPGARRVHTFHGHVLEGYFPAPMSWALRRWERALARRTDAVLAVSEATREDLVRLGVTSLDRIEVVPPGIELDALLALPPDRPGAALRRELGLPPQALVVGVIGRLAAVKRTALAIEVFASVAGEFPMAHLVVAGDGAERADLEGLRAALAPDVGGRVHLLGAVPDVVGVHEALDVLLSTSRSEGMPVAMIEAGAAARPVVSTAVGGVPELVRSGVTGLFGTDRDALAAALAGLLSDADTRASFGAAAREHVAAHHSGDALATRLEAVYARVVASSS